MPAHPDDRWAIQHARTLLMTLGDRAADFRFLIRDRAEGFADSFRRGPRRRRPGRAGSAPAARGERIRGALRAHARTEATARMLILGERHLRMILAGHETHYGGRRPPHTASCTRPRPEDLVAEISRERIKRLISGYKRAA
jgi:putative transposase